MDDSLERLKVILMTRSCSQTNSQALENNLIKAFEISPSSHPNIMISPATIPRGAHSNDHPPSYQQGRSLTSAPLAWGASNNSRRQRIGLVAIGQSLFALSLICCHGRAPEVTASLLEGGHQGPRDTPGSARGRSFHGARRVGPTNRIHISDGPS